MRSSVLWRKQSRIIMMLAKSLHIDAERALNLFYTTKVYQHLSDPKYGLQLMSDDYILELHRVVILCAILIHIHHSYSPLENFRMSCPSAA